MISLSFPCDFHWLFMIFLVISRSLGDNFGEVLGDSLGGSFGDVFGDTLGDPFSPSPGTIFPPWAAHTHQLTHPLQKWPRSHEMILWEGSYMNLYSYGFRKCDESYLKARVFPPARSWEYQSYLVFTQKISRVSCHTAFLPFLMIFLPAMACKLPLPSL